MFKKLLFVISLYFSLFVFAANPFIELTNTSSMELVKHIDADPTSFNNALAMNIPYGPILEIRKRIEEKLGLKLKFLTAWQIEGEAHITTITPPEFVNSLSTHISMKRIHEIAENENIQFADLKFLGVGSGKKLINGKEEQTFFIIVDSFKLREIRFKIYQEFIKNGGDAHAFDPTWFFPHITIGYTLRDLHEPDVLKNMKHSLDKRFSLLNNNLFTLNQK